MIRSEASVRIQRSVDDVFAFVEDPANAPKWLEYCIELTQTSSGVRDVGAALRYVHRQGGRASEMQGVVTAYEPNRRLGMRYADAMFEVEVELIFADDEGSTQVTHGIGIVPRSVGGRLLTPVISAGNRRQVVRNLERVKRIVEQMAD